MNVVLDASVVAKWYFEEENTNKSLTLLEKHKTEDCNIAVPLLLLFEFGNISITKFGQKITFKRELNRNLSNLLRSEINFIKPSEEILRKTLALACQYKITFYDATYVATAKKLKCEFVTADEKLYNATKKLKFVKLL